MKSILSLLCLSVLIGCAKSPPTKTAAGSLPKSIDSFFPAPPVAKDRPHDPAADPKLLVELTIYKLTVPARFVSHNEEFWKHVDEQSLDVAQHDTLFANGFRVGIAPRGDWNYFKTILEKESVTSQMNGGAGIGGSVLEMPFKQGVPEQDVMYIHPTKGLIGQTYNNCDIAMSVHFEPVPRQTGEVRITAVPLFRSEREEISYSALNQPIPSLHVRPEYKFDLKLDVTVPLDNFLIISPSADADRAVTLGNKLLKAESEGKEYETVLLLSPQPFQFEKPTTQPSQTAEAMPK